ncbi:MAG: hypothetical protein NWE84_00845 [Candidatus Bathyarchaeota archaeon]|nr:hypothetical protein [Candidatus Bathyarchaeota archaeon]
MSTKPKKLLPKFELTTRSEFRVVHINAFFGGLSPIEGRIAFFTDILEPKMKVGGNPGEMEVDKINRERQIDIRMSVMDFVNLAAWMNKHVKRLESQGILKKGEIAKSKPTNYTV